jgi:hypothetical protein
VKYWFVNYGGPAADSFVTKGLGKSRPIAPNTKLTAATILKAGDRTEGFLSSSYPNGAGRRSLSSLPFYTQNPAGRDFECNGPNLSNRCGLR